MRQVVGSSVRDVDGAAFAERRAGFERTVLDLGTGDGKHVLALARRRPDTFVVGVDASPDGMRRAAGRAAAKPARGGLPNAMFVWASAERLPVELADLDAVHVLMPWGSLLRAVVEPDDGVLRRMAVAAGPGAELLITLNLHAWRPAVPEVGETAEPTPESFLDRADAYAAAGWQLDEAAYATDGQLAELGTSWTKRLSSSRTALDVLTIRGRRAA